MPIPGERGRLYFAEYGDRIRISRGGQLSRAWLEWTPQGSLEAMDENGVDVAILSMSTPGVWFGDADAARRTARECNEYAAALVQQHPQRFRFFATIALPDSDRAIREIEYAIDVLGAAGVALLTNYDGKWLGHEDYAPVFEELHRRGAVTFIHPTAPESARGLLPNISPMIAEVPHDTTRAVVNMLLNGTMTRYPLIRFVLAHAGGTLPMVVGRIKQYAARSALERMPNSVEFELRRLFYDVAGTTTPSAIAALMALVECSQILFGSDEPHVPIAETITGLKALNRPTAMIAAIQGQNAQKLFGLSSPTK